MVINHLKLYCAYLEEQRFFYTRKFNFKVVDEGDKEISLKFGNSLLTFTENRMQNSYYHFAFNIPYALFDDAQKWVKNKVELLKYENKEIMDFSKWDAKSFYFLDPAGNIVEFIGRKNLVMEEDEDSHDDEFNEEKVLHLSEVGLPVFQVSSAFKKISEETGIPPFDCEDNNFCACGDDRGLFIIVDKAEKTWFPTKERAKGYPLEVKFESLGRKFSLLTDSGEMSVRAHDEK